MFSCCHFFLSNRKQSVQSALSNRRQEKHLQKKVVHQWRSPGSGIWWWPSQKTVSLVPWNKSSYLSSLLRLNKAVFAHAFGNECRIRVHTQPNILKSGKRISLKNKVPGNKTKEATRKIFLSTRTIGWKLALDKPLETEARFRWESTLDNSLETKTVFRHK